MFLQNMIEKAIFLNTVVWEPEFCGNKLTVNFIRHLLDEAINLKLGRMTNLYIPTGITHNGSDNHFCGLSIITDSRLDHDGSLFSYYIKRSIELGYKKERLFPIGRDRLILCASCEKSLLGAL